MIHPAWPPAIEDASLRGLAPRIPWPQTPITDRLIGWIMQRIKGWKLVAPAMPPKGYKKNRLGLENFELDEKGLVRKCPAGHAPCSTSMGSKRIHVQARFDAQTCFECEFRDRCVVKEINGYARIQYDYKRLRPMPKEARPGH